MIIVTGKITTGSYTTQSGETKYTMQVTADRVEFVGMKKSDSSNQPSEQYGDGCFLDILDDELPFL